MNAEIQIWPYLYVNINYTIRFVGYRIIYRSATFSIQISTYFSLESRPAPYWLKTFDLTVATSASLEPAVPTGLVNSEGNNLFIGNSL